MAEQNQWNQDFFTGLESFVHNYTTDNKSLEDLRQAHGNIVRQIALYDMSLARGAHGPN